jgi:hypothetical protein
MLAKMIDKIVSLKETKTFEIGGQTYTDGHLTRIPPHVDRPEAISVSGLDGVCKLIRTELEKVGTTIMVQAKSYKSVEVMTTYLPDFSRNILYRAEADAPGIYTGFRAQFVPNLCDESGNRAFGLTIFPVDGSAPIVCISAEAPISAAPELLAHELAHVATPEDKDHGEAWQTAEKAIGDKYDEILNTMIPDDDPGVLVPHEAGDGGILAMPLRENIPEPGRDDWKLTTCPVCGAECWETEIARQALAAEPELRAACTACALRGGRSGR